MRKISFVLFPFILMGCGGAGSTDETIVTDTIEVVNEEVVENERKSPRTILTANENGVELTIDYGSPRVKERQIWGGLVPYDNVWRAGADEVTAITFKADANFAGKTIAAGTYGLFLVPHENKDWEVVINEEWSRELHDVWGAYDYRQDKDIFRVSVKPIVADENTENLTYVYKNGKLIFKWEFIRLEIPISPAVPA